MGPNRIESHDVLFTMGTWKRTDYTDSQEAKLKHTMEKGNRHTEGETRGVDPL